MSRNPCGITVCEQRCGLGSPSPAAGLGWCLAGGCLVLQCAKVFFCCEQVCSELLSPAVPQLESMRLWSCVTMTRHATWAKVQLGMGTQSALGQALALLGSCAPLCVLHEAWQLGRTDRWQLLSGVGRGKAEGQGWFPGHDLQGDSLQQCSCLVLQGRAPAWSWAHPAR